MNLNTDGVFFLTICLVAPQLKRSSYSVEEYYKLMLGKKKKVKLHWH